MAINQNGETWTTLKVTLEERLDRFRKNNDGVNVDHDETQILRGRIAEIKFLLSLPDQETKKAHSTL